MRVPLLVTLRTGQVGTFSVSMPANVSFGYGTRNEIPETIAKYGKRVLYVTGKRSLKTSGLLNELVDAAKAAELEPVVFDGVEAEPLVETVDRCRDMLLDEDIEVVVTVGGGSVIDVGKAAAALVDSELPTAEHLAGAEMPEDGLPIIAAPTTSGTGAEVTPNAVLRDLSAGTKASIRGDHLLPIAAIVDPQLTMHASAQVTAHSGLDALTQAIEAYTSLGANTFTDGLAFQAAIRIGVSLQMACLDAKSWPARESMALGSLFAGIALASARLGLVHGLAHPIGMIYGIPHGQICALLLPYVMDYNAPACGEKYATLAQAMGVGESPDDLILWVRKLSHEIGVTGSPGDHGLKSDDLDRIIPPTIASGSTKHNPREVTEEELAELLNAMMLPGDEHWQGRESE
ncbi:MAG TPA: iron-containing alcohol dehydrogenase [Armatimonadota bacterium]|nr:iron-containing alcohol dehydrogenase [Armatimonadota bacterium]